MSTQDAPQDGELTLRYENDAETSVAIHKWERIGPNTVRWIDKERMFNGVKEEWEEVSCFTHDYEIDQSGRLVGDGSNWDGEGMLWYEYARERHEVLIRKRYPYDFSDPDPSAKEVAKELIKANY